MGLFDSTISTLSKLALNESSLDIPEVTSPALVDDFVSEINLMPTLNESEMFFPVNAVPIRKSERLGRYLIEMEDLSRYMLTNNITNLLEAVGRIGASNMIDLDASNTMLVIDETSVLQEMEDLGMNIGGSHHSEGNIGTTGLLGQHDDIHKFRRFANSREFLNTVCNKYGLPVAKKNYTIGLVKVHNEAYEEDVEPKVKENTMVLNEKPEKTKKQVYNGPKYATWNSVNEDTTSSQYIRDLAYGKYDDELVNESYGGPAVRSPYL